MLGMIFYIITSQLLYLWQYGIVSAIALFCVLMIFVVGLCIQDVKREHRLLKRHSDHVRAHDPRGSPCLWVESYPTVKIQTIANKKEVS
jgi:hypothetical protein